jgi:hypothetical protein
MRGGSQSQLLRCSDGHSYVVKFQNNPQGIRTLANEVLGALLARALGLPVPDIAIVDVCERVIRYSGDLSIQLKNGSVPCQAGPCFGSRHLGSRLGQQNSEIFACYDILPEALLCDVENLSDFAGMLVFDKWTGNTDNRQVVLVPSEGHGYRAVMIDHGYCFHNSAWVFRDVSFAGLYRGYNVYRAIDGIHAFEPWLDRLERSVNISRIKEIARSVPPEWYHNDEEALRLLLAQLDWRRMEVRKLLYSLLKQLPKAFPRCRSGNLNPVPNTNCLEHRRENSANSGSAACSAD